MSAILLAMALAAQPAPAAPTEASTRSRPMLPFESGYLAVTLRGSADGTTDCSAMGEGPGFVTAAATFCRGGAEGPESAAGGGDPYMTLTMAFAIMPEGSAEGFAMLWPGRLLFDAEAQIDVAPDGAITACNMVSQEGDVAIVFGGRPMCDDLQSGPSAIRAAPPGSGPRRGSLRIIAFADGPADGSSEADVRR